MLHCERQGLTVNGQAAPAEYKRAERHALRCQCTAGQGADAAAQFEQACQQAPVKAHADSSGGGETSRER